MKLIKGDIYLMIDDKQESFIFNSIDDVSFEELFTLVKDRLEKIFQEYKAELNNSCDSILFDFWPVIIKDNLKISNLKEAKEGLSNLSFKAAKTGFNYFGNSLEVQDIPLNVKLSDNKLNLDIKELEYSKDMDKFIEKFFSKFNSGNTDYYFDENSKFYLINFQNKNFIIIINKIDDNKVNKRCFNRFAYLID